MGNFFNMDNAFFSTLNKFTDMLFLSVIWIILCIPIITIGPATTALYYATVKVVRKERGYLMREFFKSFRMNFKRGAIVGVILSIVYMILAFDLYYSWTMLAVDSKKGSVLLGVFIALTFITLCFTLYVYPILSRFDMTVKQLMKAAIYMSMRHLPFTVAMAVVAALGIASVLFVSMVLLFILPALIMFINSFMMERVFRKYMPQSEGPAEETGKDEWYLD
ncbi:DUF624 domain-containing protein [Mobilitalea sibirica]|uniref:DUF624 domain-containing protein n=1 Tax=Mobilitalea sibirica TaxID=1462919 RepID=A0A8J7HAL3_9FIRM|nr:DUF624 domain-containing protein [Mobilitalea sibirica]MBH1940061.1 DUF624 domain-containing protein [Mobilitalea sibirica]